MEFLIGRTFSNAMLAAGPARAGQASLGWTLGWTSTRSTELEPDAALGNGGLGRLAACFLDSMATLDIPGFGYGIRYDYGMFTQTIVDGRQVEVPDYWLTHGNPWEFPRPEVNYRVQFGGHVVKVGDAYQWVDSHDVQAMAYDTIIPGYGTKATNTLASVVRQGHRRDRSGRLQPRQLHGRGGDEEPLRERVSRALPGRLHALRPRAALAPGVLLLQRQRAGPAAPLPAHRTTTSRACPTRSAST